MKKRKLNSKNPKYMDKSLLNKQEEKKRVHACTTPSGCKVYAVWYKQCYTHHIRGEGGKASRREISKVVTESRGQLVITAG